MLFQMGKLVYRYALVVLLPDMTYNQRWCAVFIPAIGSFLVGDILGPTVYRKGLDLNEVVILLALVFWFSVWGGVGAVLAVPIMCTVKIIMEEIPHEGTHALARMMAPAPSGPLDDTEELLGGDAAATAAAANVLDDDESNGGAGLDSLDGGGRRRGARTTRPMGWLQWGWSTVRHSQWYAKLAGSGGESHQNQSHQNDATAEGGVTGDMAAPLLAPGERAPTRRAGFAPGEN